MSQSPNESHPDGASSVPPPRGLSEDWLTEPGAGAWAGAGFGAWPGAQDFDSQGVDSHGVGTPGVGTPQQGAGSLEPGGQFGQYGQFGQPSQAGQPHALGQTSREPYTPPPGLSRTDQSDRSAVQALWGRVWGIAGVVVGALALTIASPFVAVLAVACGQRALAKTKALSGQEAPSVVWTVLGWAGIVLGGLGVIRGMQSFAFVSHLLQN